MVSNTATRPAANFLDIARAALLATAPVGPLVAALLVVSAALTGALPEVWFAYLPAWILLPGLVYLLTAWVLIALLWALLGFTDVAHANAGTFRELKNQLTEAHAAVLRLGERAACAANAYLNDVRVALEHDAWPRTNWVLGTGYVSVWQLLHRAQEALITAEPVSGVIARAQYDLMRLANSDIANREVLRERLSQTIDLLMPLGADAADLEARSTLVATLASARQQLRSEQTLDCGQAQAWLAQLHVIQQAILAAPVAGDIRLPLLVELRTAIRDLTAALNDAVTADRASATAGTLQRNGLSAAEEVLAAAGVGLARAEEAGAVLQSGESTASTTEQPPQAAEPPDSAPARRTYQILNWRALSERLDKLIEYLSAGTSDAPRQDLSVVETVVTRMRDQSTLRPPEFVAEARLVVSTIRQTLNEYRDDSRAGLVRARNQLAWTCVVTALCAYAVVWLAVASSVPKAALQVGVAYFLVGALVGLFSRLNSELGADTATDDYGLSSMRLIAAPQLAGVAAVAGVALLALTGMSGGAGSGGLEKAFELPLLPANMLAAAAFGFAPGMLIDRLKQQTEGLKGNLQATMPQGTAAAKG